MKVKKLESAANTLETSVSVSGIKKLLKKGKAKKDAPEKYDALLSTQKPIQKKRKSTVDRGLVYVAHIPHGFYEPQMAEYFKQFGKVTAVRVIRSKKTGQSKGCAFVEFQEPAVAKVVAETMDNYLMGKRLLKAKLIPPEEQKRRPRKNWNYQKNPSADYRLKMKKIFNDDFRDDIKFAKKQLVNILKTKQKLKELGIDYDFFKPVDVPEELTNLLNSETPTKPNKSETKTDLNEKAKKIDKTAKTVDVKPEVTKDTKIEKNASKKNIDKNNKKSENKIDLNGKSKTIDKTANMVDVKAKSDKKVMKNTKIDKKSVAVEIKETVVEDESSNDSFDSSDFKKALEYEDLDSNDSADEKEEVDFDSAESLDGSASDDVISDDGDSDGDLVFGGSDVSEEDAIITPPPVKKSKGKKSPITVKQTPTPKSFKKGRK